MGVLVGWLVDPSTVLSRAGSSRLKNRGGWRLDTSDVIPQKRTYRQTDRQTDKICEKKLKMIGLS